MRVTASNAWLAHAVRSLTRWYPIPARPRERFARLLFRPDHMTPYPFTVPLHGIVYDGDLAVYQDWRIFFLGSFERETVNLLADLLAARPGSTFLDVGANKGLFAATLSRCAAVVHAFEPFPPIAAAMRSLLARNGIANVTVHELALGAHAETRTYYPPGGGNIGVGSFLREHQADAAVTPVDLGIVRGDDVVPPHGPPVAAIKIDTEGFEAYALTGLTVTLNRDRPAVVFETSASTAKTVAGPAAFAALFPSDYRFFRIVEHSRARRWRLSAQAIDTMFTDFGNWLACPAERVPPPYL